MTETINRLNLWERNIKPRWRNTDYPQFFLVLCRRGRGSSTLHVCAQGAHRLAVCPCLTSLHLVLYFLFPPGPFLLSYCFPPYHPHHLHLSPLTFGWPFCLSLSLTHSLLPHLSSLSLFLRNRWGQISSLTGWLSYCGCPCWHTHKHTDTQLMALQGTETASGWNRDRQLINNDTDLPRRRSRMILYRRRLAACMTSYLARWILGHLLLWVADR